MNKKLSKKISTLCEKTGIYISKDFYDGFTSLEELEYYVDDKLEELEELEHYDDTLDELEDVEYYLYD